MAKKAFEIKLPQDVRARWLDALRNGGYKQTRGRLYNEKGGGFCCLGVLEHCEMDGEVECHVFDGGVLGHPLYMPTRAFYEYAGIDSKQDDWYKFETKLQQLNDDSKRNFATIADYIEANTVGVS